MVIWLIAVSKCFPLIEFFVVARHYIKTQNIFQKAYNSLKHEHCAFQNKNVAHGFLCECIFEKNQTFSEKLDVVLIWSFM